VTYDSWKRQALNHKSTKGELPLTERERRYQRDREAQDLVLSTSEWKKSDRQLTKIAAWVYQCAPFTQFSTPVKVKYLLKQNGIDYIDDSNAWNAGYPCV
jgi:hypothetical protein